MVKNLPAMQEIQVQSLGREDPLEENGNPLQFSCLENSIDGGTWWASLWDCKESDTTEGLTFSLSTTSSPCGSVGEFFLLSK